MTRVFISYAHTAADSWLAERLEFWLDRQGISVWRDKTGMVAGDDYQARIDEAIAGVDAAIFLVSPEWKLREWTGWELERVATHDPTGARIARIAVYRVPIAQLPQGPPPRLLKYHAISWEDGVHDDAASFWQLLCGVQKREGELGLEHTWSASGAPLVAETPRTAAPTAPRAPRKPKPRRAEKPSLECGRGDEWLMVQQMYSSAAHQISIVGAQRHEAQDTFVERIEKKLIANAAPPVRRVDWPTRPINQQDYYECLAAALSPRETAVSTDDLPKLFERLLADSNAILLHSLIEDRFDDEKLIRYYTEWLPALLPKDGDVYRLKCVQPVAWSPAGGAKKLGRDLSSALKLRGVAEWFVAPDERLARLFMTRLSSSTGTALKSTPIDLTPIDEEDVESFCRMKGIEGAAREEILRRTRRGGAIQTSAQVLFEIDKYFDEHAAAAAGEPR